MRKHGFQLPLNLHQIITIGVFAGTCLVFFLVTISQFEFFVKDLLMAFYLCLAGILTFCYVVSSLIDPSDYGNAKDSQQSYCTICKDLRAVDSKHCARCDRCTLKFDHHCKWINNCIGRKNYRWFLGLVFSAELFCVFFGVVNGISLERLLHADEKNYVFIVFSFFSEALVLLACSFLLHLVFLHGFLGCKGLTTYEYILLKRRRSVVAYKSNEHIIPDTYVKTDNSNDISKIK